MKIIYLTTAALLAAAPAAAQPWQGQRTQSAALQIQLDAGVRSGSISQRELPPLRESLRQLVMRERQFSPGGISGRENAVLQQESNALRQQIALASSQRGGGNGRYDTDQRAGWEARYDREHRTAWEERYMSDRNAAWEDRDDRDGRDDRYGASSRFEMSNRGDRFAGDARVGQRATRRMVDLPDQYRDEYRDSDEVYYRYDSDRVYEIDRSNGLILRLFDLIR
ncbi:MAG TPA: hypothetical protein VK472_06260 [Allosphingosinicella sp.]|nr:hypothetical protein [Allosphingosinicella sp.]